MFAYSLSQPAQASPQATQRAASTTAGLQLGTYAWFCKLSGDGKFVVFYSQANPLQAVPVVAYAQIYRRELATGAMSLVTQTTTGSTAVLPSRPESVTFDGRFVSFTSQADNLIANDQNGQLDDVFVRDVSTGVTEIASVATSGAPGNGASFDSSISADGRYVAFDSFASSLVPLDLNQCPDVFLRDCLLHTTTRVSVSSSGAESSYPINLGCIPYPDCAISGVAISGDGRYVAFGSTANNLVPNDTNQSLDVFIHDTLTGATDLVSQTPSGVPANNWSFAPALSFDGGHVSFVSWATDLVVGMPPTGGPQIFLRDRTTSTSQLVSCNNLGQPADYECFAHMISADGAFVAFTTESSNLVVPDTNAAPDAFLRDIQAGTTIRLSNSLTGGSANGETDSTGISSDGSLVLMASAATNSIAGDIGVGGGVVLVDRTITATPIATYCTGKTNSSNCTPAIAPTGLPSISGKYVFFVTATKVLNHRVGSLVWGTAAAQTPFMGGTLCVQAPTKITAPQDSHGDPAPSTNCSGWHSFLMTPQWMQARGWLAGTTICCQYFCRDPALAAPNQMSLSDGLRFTVVP